MNPTATTWHVADSGWNSASNSSGGNDGWFPLVGKHFHYFGPPCSAARCQPWDITSRLGGCRKSSPRNTLKEQGWKNGMFKLSVIRELINKEALPCKTPINRTRPPALRWVLRSGVESSAGSQLPSSNSIIFWVLKVLEYLLKFLDGLFSEHQVYSFDLLPTVQKQTSPALHVPLNKVSLPLFPLEKKTEQWHEIVGKRKVCKCYFLQLKLIFKVHLKWAWGFHTTQLPLCETVLSSPQCQMLRQMVRAKVGLWNCSGNLLLLISTNGSPINPTRNKDIGRSGKFKGFGLATTVT